jgi:hypothetical protein
VSERAWRPDPASTLGAAVLATYLLVAQGIGDLYPFSTFSMYSAHPTDSGSRIVARDASGALRELSAYERWTCPRDGALEQIDACGEVTTIDYLDREAREYLAEHAGPDAPAPPGSEPVEVVRRIWRFGGEAPLVRDCPLARCRAVRR